jgi:Kef-type K+ transport system membrane component KefB
LSSLERRRIISRKALAEKGYEGANLQNLLRQHSGPVNNTAVKCKSHEPFYKALFYYIEVATEQLFVNIIIILVAARILGEVFQRFGQPPLVGELLAGLIIGQSIFGLVLPSTDLHVLSNLAVFFLMFLAGLEMDPREISRSGRSAIVISIIAFFIPLLSGTFASLLFGLTTVQSLFMGLLLSITAVPVSAIVLMNMRNLAHKIAVLGLAL